MTQMCGCPNFGKGLVLQNKVNRQMALPYSLMGAAMSCLLAFAMLLFIASPALASFDIQSLLSGASGSGAATGGQCDQYHGLTNKVVLCMRYTIDQAALVFFNEVFPIFANGVTAVLTIAVVVFGVMITAGMLERPSRDGMVFLVKIAAAGFTVTQIPYLYSMVMSVMDGLVAAVTQFAASGFPAQHCEYLATTWDRVDCMLDVLIGFEYIDNGTALSGTPLPSLSKGILGFLFMSLGASVVGAVIALVGLYVVLSLVFGIVRAIFLYITAVIGMVFIAIIGPMFIPLILFTGTRQYFDAYIKIIISFLLQVTIVFAYLVFMTIAIDTLVYSGNQSFLRTLVGTNDFNASTYEEHGRFNINKWIKLKNEEVVDTTGCGYDGAGRVQRLVEETGPTVRVDGRLPGEEEAGLSVGGTVTPIVRETTDQIMAMGEEAGILPFGNRIPAINWDCMARVTSASSGDTIDQEIFIRMLTLAVMMFVFKSMLDYIPVMANDLSGGFYATPNLYGHVTDTNPIRDVTEPVGNTINQTLVGRRGGG